MSQLGTLYLTAVSFAGNVGLSRGGGMAIEAVYRTLGTGLAFLGNMALTGTVRTHLSACFKIYLSTETGIV